MTAPPGPGPVETVATLRPAADNQNPRPNKFPELPLARTIISASSTHGTLVCAVVLSEMAKLSKPAVPPTPQDRSKRAVPGVVTVHEIRPAALMCSTSPIFRRFG